MRFFKIWPFVPTLFVFLVIAYLSLARDPIHADRIHLFEGADKVVHGCMYLGLVVVGCYDMYRLGFRFTPRRLALWLFVAIAWGGVMELLQGAMGLGRSADWFDFLANSCGALSGLLLGVWGIPRLFRRYKGKLLFHVVDDFR
ncbi:MAG TPA: hypothetical protein H9834_10790 [Candidatus Barnesiella excrementavium]|nr:hypothetical protein [Candidatus Barnesiella excrementavium]